MHTHTAYRSLVEENPDNYRFHAGLQAAVLDLPPAVAAAAAEGGQVCVCVCVCVRERPVVSL